MNKFASFILSTMLSSVITLAFVHYLIEPDLDAKAVNHVKADLLAHLEFLQQLADAYQTQQATRQQVQTAQGVRSLGDQHHTSDNALLRSLRRACHGRRIF
ncbi:hypothetical protein [Vibrio mediterranei]|uniref:hypothetical protein n=1 Tax=Vibrio mediterranei TaxID=689 RepID=UPI002285125E|nr:hypothetical protein [Vibrio mediterranei]MCY9855657.1 hypothetical protein [Vibrio mediterranei]